MFTNFDTATTPVPETAFIGRKSYLASLRREFCTDRDARISYCGLLKTGKTGIMARFQEQVNRAKLTTPQGYRCVVAYYPLYILTTSLFVVLTEEIDYTLSAQNIDCPENIKSLCDQVKAVESKRDQARKMSQYVNALYDNGIRIILVLDELQCAPERKVLSFDDFALLNNMRNISIAYVGRLFFDKTMNDLSPSVWNNQLPCQQEVILGFDENDMQEYCSIFYGSKYGYDITWLLKDLEKYCGRSPYLLAYFGNKIWERLEYDDPDSINPDFLKAIYDSLVSLGYHDGVEKQLSLDTYRDMTNLERLRRIAVGPQIGIYEWDLALMRQLGYITDTGRASYAISPVFEERLAMLPISGELPLKLVTAETYLRRLIHKKIPEIRMENQFTEPLQTVVERMTCKWTDIDRTILNLELRRVPDNVPEKYKLDRPYKLYNPSRDESPHKKYALWVASKQKTMPEANIEEVMLLKDRLGLIIGCWRYFSEFFDGGNREVWKQKFYLMCIARNPALHAGTLTKQEQIDCERTCDDIIRTLGNLEMIQEE